MIERFNILAIDENNGNDNTEIKYAKSRPNNEYMLKITDIDKLLDIFYETPDDIFKYNISDLLTFILNDGNEISLHQYLHEKKNRIGWKPSYIKDIAFIKLYKENTCEILISTKTNCDVVDWKYPMFNKTESEYDSWKPMSYVSNSNAEKYKKDFNGYENSQKLKNLYDRNYIPAITYCDKLQYEYNGDLYQGYLPAAGELLYIKYMFAIIEYLIGYPIHIDTISFWMSSTLYNDDYVWTIYPIHERLITSLQVDSIAIQKTKYINAVFPAFKKITNKNQLK